MKHYLALCLCLAAVLTACDNGKAQREQEQNEMDEATRQELLTAIAERDQLIQLVNEITATTNEIKNLEDIVSINAAGGEGNQQKWQVSSDIDAIRATLAERRKKIEELEQSLRSSSTANQKLLSTIDGLKIQIENQASEIEQLSQSLKTAHEKITQLDQQVDSLGSQVNDITQQRDQAQAAAQKQEMLANACYYVVATKDELKAHNIVTGGGFLKSEKVLDGEFDKSFFIQADKRNLFTIPLHCKKAKVLTTTQPKDSYEIVDMNGEKVLRIINANTFWGTSNFLVIQID